MLAEPWAASSPRSWGCVVFAQQPQHTFVTLQPRQLQRNCKSPLLVRDGDNFPYATVPQFPVELHPCHCKAFLPAQPWWAVLLSLGTGMLWRLHKQPMLSEGGEVSKCFFIL